MILQTTLTVTRWVALPVLVMLAILSRFTAAYQLQADFAVLLAAVILAGSALRTREYLWSGGLIAVGIVFIPLGLALKLFILMGFISCTTCAIAIAAYRTTPALAE